MQIQLQYENGYIKPNLHLTDDERVAFDICNIPKYITYAQMILGLGELNPRYPRNNQECRAYQPTRILTRENLETCATFIINDIQQLLDARGRPVTVSKVSTIDTTELDLVREVELIFPDFTDELHSAQLVINGRIYNLNPVETEPEPLYQELEERYKDRFSAYEGSVMSQLDAIKEAYETRIRELEEELAKEYRLPRGVTLLRLINENILFASAYTNSYQHNMRYVFCLPFKLRQNKVKIHGTDVITRFIPSLRVNEDCYLYMTFSSSGHMITRELKVDRRGSQWVEHHHSLSGEGEFCSGSVPSLNLTFSEDVLQQVVDYRDKLEELLEVVNTDSLGTTGLPQRLRYLIDTDHRYWMTDDEIQEEDLAIENGEAEPIEGVRGTGHTRRLWHTEPEEVQVAARNRGDFFIDETVEQAEYADSTEPEQVDVVEHVWVAQPEDFEEAIPIEAVVQEVREELQTEESFEEEEE